MFGHIQAWEDSNQTQAAYCEENGLCRSTFNYWRRKYQETEFVGDDFIEINSETAGTFGGLSIHYPNGVVVNINEPLPASQILQLTRL